MNNPRRKSIYIFLILIIVAVGYLVFRFFFDTIEIKTNTCPQQDVVINDTNYMLEVASTPEKMAKGLGGKDYLCNRCGMIFIFSQEGKHSFWMKGMKIPLDILWIFGNKIVHIEKNVPADSSEIMNPDVLSDKVIEINGGTVDKEGIMVGQEARLE